MEWTVQLLLLLGNLTIFALHIEMAGKAFIEESSVPGRLFLASASGPLLAIGSIWLASAASTVFSGGLVVAALANLLLFAIFFPLVARNRYAER